MAYKVKVDTNLCVGSSDCINVAANTFRLNSENKSEVIAQSLDQDNTILEAARVCPTKAIIVEDENGNQIYP